MKDLLTFVGGVAVGILAAAGIYVAVDGDDNQHSMESEADGQKELEENDIEDEANDDGSLTVRVS